jgi:hypothetical protein
MPSENIEVKQDIKFTFNFSAEGRDFWRYEQNGRYNDSTIRDRAMYILTVGGLAGNEWCYIDATTVKGAPQPSLTKGVYEVYPEELIIEKNGKLGFKVIGFKINNHFRVDCYLTNPNSNIRDVKALLDPIIIMK